MDELRRSPVILNAARGPITSTGALLSGLRSGKISAAGIDCWENEPGISTELLEACGVATPHIAGYSRQGKIRATAMAVDAVSRRFGFTPAPLTEEVPGPAPRSIELDRLNYDILADTALLRAAAGELPASFESLRNGYRLRPEAGYSPEA